MHWSRATLWACCLTQRILPSLLHQCFLVIYCKHFSTPIDFQVGIERSRPTKTLRLIWHRTFGSLVLNSHIELVWVKLLLVYQILPEVNLLLLRREHLSLLQLLLLIVQHFVFAYYYFLPIIVPNVVIVCCLIKELRSTRRLTAHSLIPLIILRVICHVL